VRKSKSKRAMTTEELIAALPPPTPEEVQIFRKYMWAATRDTALAQVVRAAPDEAWSTDSVPLFQGAAFLSTFLARTGTESVLSRLMAAATNASMDCFARAKSKDATVRDLELNFAAKLALVAAALAKALDQHRGSSGREEFFVPPVQSPRKVQANGSTRPVPAQTSAGNSLAKETR